MRLLGLNSALLSASDLDRGRLRLGMEPLARSLETVQPDELVVVLTHHPLRDGWLADQSTVLAWLQANAHVHLAGHLHAADVEETRSGSGGRFLRITAGAAHGDPQPEGIPAGHGYSFAAVVPGPGPGELSLRLWPRRWSDKNKDFRPDQECLPRGRAHAEHSLRLVLPAPGG